MEDGLKIMMELEVMNWGFGGSYDGEGGGGRELSVGGESDRGLNQESPMDRPPGASRGVNLRGSSGSMENPSSKKIPFLYHSDHSE